MEHPKTGSSSTVSRLNMNLDMSVFMQGGKLENAEKKPQIENSQQQTQPKYGMGFEPRLHWWKASALTTASSSYCNVKCDYCITSYHIILQQSRIRIKSEPSKLPALHKICPFAKLSLCWFSVVRLRTSHTLLAMNIQDCTVIRQHFPCFCRALAILVVCQY